MGAIWGGQRNPNRLQEGHGNVFKIQKDAPRVPHESLEDPLGRQGDREIKVFVTTRGLRALKFKTKRSKKLQNYLWDPDRTA